MDDADGDDALAAFVELLLKKQQPAKQQAESKTPHFGEHSVPTPAPGVKSVFGSKHCMFSYNWAVQEQVKAARSEVGAAGVPTWMDIDGEPARGCLPSLLARELAPGEGLPCSPRAPKGCVDRRGVGRAQAG